MDDWVAAVCRPGGYDPTKTNPLICFGNHESGGFRGELFAYQFVSPAEMQANRGRWDSGYPYATCASADGGVAAFISDVSGIGSQSTATDIAERDLEPLTKYGCTITHSTPHQSPLPSQNSQVQAAPRTPEPTQALPAPRAAPPVASPAHTNTPSSLPDADAQGFLNYPGARCNSTNPASAIARTAQSLVVICQTGVGRFYYRGLGLQNGLSVEIDDPIRSGAGFVATNNGVQYSVSPTALTITQGSKVLSSEPTLEYWSQ
jgi:hypothetical protein